jgi:hypothetical protein
VWKSGNVKESWHGKKSGLGELCMVTVKQCLDLSLSRISHELLYGENKLLSYKSDFIRQFPPVYEWEKVVNLIVGWLEKVQGMVEDLQAPFDPLRRSSERVSLLFCLYLILA